MQSFTVEQAALLTGNRLEVDFGADVLNLDLTVATDYGDQGDVSADLRGGSISWNGFASIHRTCRLDLSVELPWGRVLVRPWMSVGGERWSLGAFMLVTPEKPVGESPATFSCQGMDRLYLLDREVGEDYTVTAGTTYRAAIEQVFADAGLSGVQIEGAAADYTLPVDKLWPLVATSSDPDENVGNTPATFLRLVNDLQQAWNGRGVWCNESGLFVCQAYQEPSVRAVEWTFDADDEFTTVVGEDRTVVADIWKQPNRWVVLWKNRPGGMQAVEGDGMWTYDLPDSDPMSAVNRGLTWTKVYEYEAASQAVLESIGARRVADDRRLATTVKLTSSPLPVAGHADVVQLVDAAGVSGKATASSWELDLLGADMQWTFDLVGS